MPTWDELIVRERPCGRCQATFRVRSAIDNADLSELRTLLDGGQPIGAIRRIRELTGCGLADAKGLYEHITVLRGSCRQCGTVLAAGTIVDCSRCSALNINA